MAKKGIMPKNFHEIQKLGWIKNKGRKATIETKKKMSESHKGFLLGGKLSLEHRKKLSEARKRFYTNGGVHPKGMLGKKQTNEHKMKISEANKGEKNYRWKGGYKNKLFYNRQRVVKKNSNGGSHTLQEWEELKKKYNYMCLCCKKFEPEIKLTEDHVIPISLEGSNNIENIQPLCRSCNSSKWTKIINYIPPKQITQVPQKSIAGTAPVIGAPIATT